MDCNIIKDLIPLYIDECCSDESSEEVKKHIENCAECKKIFESMTNNITQEEATFEAKKCTKINDWKASIMQSVLFLLSFLLITLGVYVEAGVGSYDWGNGLTAFNVVVPATGFMLSLTNWYFVKLYPSRKSFSWCSCLFSVLITLSATVWCSFHYEWNLLDIFIKASFIDSVKGISFIFGIGIFLTVSFAVISKILSDLYARMLGKE
ncbi:MAG: zf-HC2 domain-containing protein [Clostridia bacterium]|nr:zf-HC2 domain-containing protein [Clostridia bacterium]